MKRYNDYDILAWLYNRELGWYGGIIFPFLKIIAGDNLPDGAKILDLCCGTGHLATILCENGYHVTGIDGSARMLQFARKNAPSAKFILGDARTINLSPEYDAVFSIFDSLNHVMNLITRRAEFHGLCPWVNEKAAI